MTLTSLPESVSDHVGYTKVKITLINENDNLPTFSQPLHVGLYENVTMGTSVLTVLLQTSCESVGLLSLLLLFAETSPLRAFISSSAKWA